MPHFQTEIGNLEIILSVSKAEREKSMKELRGIDLTGTFKMLMSVLLWLSKTSSHHTNSQYENHEGRRRKVDKNKSQRIGLSITGVF